MTGKSREIADVISVSQASRKRSGRIKKQDKLEMATISMYYQGEKTSGNGMAIMLEKK